MHFRGRCMDEKVHTESVLVLPLEYNVNVTRSVSRVVRSF